MRYAIPGTDLDLSDLDILDVGSSLLLEVDGVDCNPGDLAMVEPLASMDWSVDKRDEDNFLVLNSLVDKKLILSKDNLINEAPAVFEQPLVVGRELKRATIIPKMVAYYVEDNGFQEYLEKQNQHRHFTRFTKNEAGIKYALSFIWNRIRNLQRIGWEHNSINRFALKSGVDINIVFFIHQNDYDKVLGSEVFDFDDIRNLFEATFRFHLWNEQAKETGVTDSIIDLPSWKDRDKT